MTKNRSNIEEILFYIAMFVLMYSIAALPAAMLLKDASIIYALLIFAAPYFFLYWVGRRLKHLAPFLLVHMALVALAFALPPSLNLKVICGVFTLVIAGYFVYRRFKAEDVEYSIGLPITHIVFSVFVSLLATFLHYGPVAAAVTFAVCIDLVCYLVSYHMRNLDDSLTLITKTTVQPVRSILSMNNRLIALFGAAAAVVAIAASQISPAWAMSLLKQLIRAIAQLIVRLFTTDKPVTMPSDSAASSTAMPAMPFDDTDIQPWPFWQVLYKILTWLFAILGVVVAVLLVVYAVKRVYKRFYSTASLDGDESEYIPPDTLTIEHIASGFKRLVPTFGPEARIRRRFYRTIKKYMKKGAPIDKTDTPDEMAAKITAEDIKPLAAEYQQARY